MNKVPFIVFSLSLGLSGCLPSFFPTLAAPVHLQNTAVVPTQTSQILTSLTPAPSNSRVVAPASPTITQTRAATTETLNPILLTLTATLGTGTVTVSGTPITPTFTPTGVTSNPTWLPYPFFILTPFETPHPQFYGTRPPYLPFGKIILINKSKTEAYISLQCTTLDGQVTILEYPVKGSVEAKAPAGRYLYVAWVGGKKFVGNFRLAKDQDLTIKLYKDQVTIGK